MQPNNGDCLRQENKHQTGRKLTQSCIGSLLLHSRLVNTTSWFLNCMIAKSAMRTVYLQLRPNQSQQRAFISMSMYPVLANVNHSVTTRVQPIVVRQRAPAPRTARILASQPVLMNVVSFLCQLFKTLPLPLNYLHLRLRLLHHLHHLHHPLPRYTFLLLTLLPLHLMLFQDHPRPTEWR